MPKKPVILGLFGLTALIQIAVPAGIAWKKETVLRSGKLFKFSIRGRDPRDFFKGSYIRLWFTLCDLPVPRSAVGKNGDHVFLVLKTDKEGYAAVKAALPERPTGTEDYVMARVVKDYRGIFFPRFEFDRFYLDEETAKKADGLAGASRRGPSYALVRIKDGDAVVENVVIQGVSLK